jgi:hypothetical protein
MSTASTTSLPQGGKSPSAGAKIIHSIAYDDDLRLYNFPHLEDDGNNYVVWKHCIEAVLELGDLWGIVNGDVLMPDPTAPPNERNKWSYKNLEARAQITHTLDDVPLGCILGATTAKDCWDRLSDWHKRIWEPQLGSLVDKVFRSTFSDSEPLGPQMNAILWAANVIRSLGLTLDDKLVANAIISSLPSSLSTLKTIMIHTIKPSELSTAQVISQVTSDEHLRISDSCVGTTEFFARAAKKGKRSRGRPKTGSSRARSGTSPRITGV